MRIDRRAAIGAVLALGAAAFAPPGAAQTAVNAPGGVAIQGFDPVAYFTDGRPVPGSPSLTHAWNGATWRFASAANRERFAADPAAYAPQYGGFCAYGAAKGYKAPIDPAAWRVVDGKLYLNYSTGVRRTWLADVPGHVRAADANWVTLQAK
jgi:hypothetical protein